MNADEVKATGEATNAVEPRDVPAAWEEIAEGRFQPRQFRGSYHGRVLG